MSGLREEHRSPVLLPNTFPCKNTIFWKKVTVKIQVIGHGQIKRLVWGIILMWNQQYCWMTEKGVLYWNEKMTYKRILKITWIFKDKTQYIKEALHSHLMIWPMPPDHGIVNIKIKGCFPQQKEYFDESINHLENEKPTNTEMSQSS